MKRLMIAIVLGLQCISLDAAEEKRPTTYAEAMKEVTRLKAENDKLRKELEELKNSLVVKELGPGVDPAKAKIEVGMTLAAVKAITKARDLELFRNGVTVETKDGQVDSWWVRKSGMRDRVLNPAEKDVEKQVIFKQPYTIWSQKLQLLNGKVHAIETTGTPD